MINPAVHVRTFTKKYSKLFSATLHVISIKHYLAAVLVCVIILIFKNIFTIFAVCTFTCDQL